MYNNLINKFKNKTLLFIGPGQSSSAIDLQSAKDTSDCIATLNDGILYHKSDIYFVGEKFICDYVISKMSKNDLDHTIMFFLGIWKKHKTRINEQYYLKKRELCTNPVFIPAIKNLKPTVYYDLPCIRQFSPKNINVLYNLYYNFPENLEYIRSRTLANSLQIIYNLGFQKVKLIGFMDSVKFSRSDNRHQSKYIKIAEKINPKIRSPQKCKEQDLKNSFDYQCQILRTVRSVYEMNGRDLINLCPKSISPQHELNYEEI